MAVLTYIEAFRVLFAVCLGDGLILHGFEYAGHRSDQCQRDARVLVRFEQHDLFAALIVRDHGQCGLLVFVVDGIVDGGQVGGVGQELAVHRQQQRDCVRLILNGRQMQRSVLHGD